MFHAVLGFAGNELSGRFRLFRAAFGFGHEAVAVFIVLSGYCLMLPVARASDERIRGTLADFLSRRARRILPPYFAALALSLLLVAVIPILARRDSGTIWDDSLPALSFWPVLTHLLLVHNWLPEFCYRINGPLWSVASEWQIYFFFPLLLLPLRRRFGSLVMLGGAAAVGYVPLAFAPGPAMAAVPWYLLLFALGMSAASINFSPLPSQVRLRAGVSWAWLALGLWLGCALFGVAGARLWFRLKPLTDLLVGVATAALLVYLAKRAASTPSGAPTGLLQRLLESRIALAIGHFSYSLYLTHLPVVALCYFTLKSLRLSPPVLAILTLLGSVPASLLAAYLFHLAFERRFMTPARR
jgi:peptidoglycan/LPS O-acetylase OafA/YrhL